HFLTVAVGGRDTSMLTRRALAIHDVKPDYGGTVELVFSVRGAGTAWLAEVKARETLDLVGPLGRPFPLPRDPCTCVLVGSEYGSASLFALGDVLQRRGCRIDFVLHASTAERVFGALLARRMGGTATLSTEDGSLGMRGKVTDVLPGVIADTRADVVYACGPMDMLRGVTAVAIEFGIPIQVAVEESMACGIGVCMTCVVPVIGEDGVTRMLRACVEGP